MIRRLAALMASTLVAGVLAALMPTAPASANVCAGNGFADVGQPGLLYPIGLPLITINLREPQNLTKQRVTVTFNNEKFSGTWTFNLAVGGCADVDPTTTCTGPTCLTAGGTLQGYCGHSAGSGTTNTGHLVAWTSIGGLLILTNGVVGVVNAIPDLLQANNSCLHAGSLTIHSDPTLTTLTTIDPPAANNLTNAGALRFIITGGAVLTNCATHILTTTLIPGDQLLTVDQLLLLTHIHFDVPHLHPSIHVCVLPSKL